MPLFVSFIYEADASTKQIAREILFKGSLLLLKMVNFFFQIKPICLKIVLKIFMNIEKLQNPFDKDYLLYQHGTKINIYYGVTFQS